MRKAHLPDSKREDFTLCGRWRGGGTETLVGPPRMQLKRVICIRCWVKYDGPIAPNRYSNDLQVAFEAQ